MENPLGPSLINQLEDIHLKKRKLTLREKKVHKNIMRASKMLDYNWLSAITLGCPKNGETAWPVSVLFVTNVNWTVK